MRALFAPAARLWRGRVKFLHDAAGQFENIATHGELVGRQVAPKTEDTSMLTRAVFHTERPPLLALHAGILALSLAGCKTTHSLDVASHTDAATAAQIETHEVKSEGPEHIVMTVEEFSQLCDPKEVSGAGGGQVLPALPAPNLSASPSTARNSATSAPQAQLIRRTVTVTDRGPSLDDLRTISSLQSKLNSATEIKTKDESKPGGIFSLWFLVGLLPLVAGVLIWKLKPSLFGVAWGALKGLLK